MTWNRLPRYMQRWLKKKKLKSENWSRGRIQIGKQNKPQTDNSEQNACRQDPFLISHRPQISLCLFWYFKEKTSLISRSQKNQFSGDIGTSHVALLAKHLPASSGDLRVASSVPGLGRSPGEGHGNPLQSSHLENLMDRGACGLQSLGLHRARHDWSNLALMHVKIWKFCLWIFTKGSSLRNGVKNFLTKKKKIPQGFPGGSVIKNLPANAGLRVWSPVREDPTWLGAAKLLCPNYEPVLCNERSQHNEKHSGQLEKAPVRQWRPSTAKNKERKLFKHYTLTFL